MTLDATTAAVRRLAVLGKERGYVTVDEFYAALDPEQVSSEMIEETLVMLSYIGIHVVMDDGPDDGDDAAGPRRPPSPFAPAVRRASAIA